MKGFFCISISVLFFLHFSEEAIAFSAPPSCQSFLGEKPEDHSAVTVDSFGISFSLPPGLDHKRGSEIDSYIDTWIGLGTSIVHEVGTISGYNPEDDRFCLLSIAGRATVVFVRESPDEMTARFSDPLRGDRFHAVSFRGPDKERQISLLFLMLKSLKVSGRFENLIVESISGDGSYFCYRNEVKGDLVARVGDVVTRDDGRVTAIRQDEIDVVELIPDGAGGYSEARRVIEVSQRP